MIGDRKRIMNSNVGKRVNMVNKTAVSKANCVLGTMSKKFKLFKT